MSRAFFAIGTEQGRYRPRPKSEFISTRDASTFQHFRQMSSRFSPPPSPGTSRRTLSISRRPPSQLKHMYTPYPLPGKSLNLRPGSVESDPSSHLPPLQSSDCLKYFHEFNDLRYDAHMRHLPEQYRFIYPPRLLSDNPESFLELQRHVSDPSVNHHWYMWMHQVRDFITEFERAVSLMGQEVEAYLKLTEAEKMTFRRIDNLDSYSTQGVNEFVEKHLNRAIQIVSARSKGTHPQKMVDYETEFGGLKKRYERAHDERRRWTRLKLGYRF